LEDRREQNITEIYKRRKPRVKRSLEFLPIPFFGYPLREEDDEEEEAASAEGEEGDAEEEVAVADEVGLAEAEPLFAPSGVDF
jgi:hypothetical protein